MSPAFDEDYDFPYDFELPAWQIKAGELLDVALKVVVAVVFVLACLGVVR